ncbi:hypothetical protein QBC36DRAFT_341291 [Triangularia setosa]|uniref:Secreted protein n=1 Tax=Triangularia setosa TaxID=2587417 RepID=A0AAN6VXW6_9PEZI|nr:hypothetical protein QBC36DRAFT_341291 [Podospora setosa]
MGSVIISAFLRISTAASISIIAMQSTVFSCQQSNVHCRPNHLSNARHGQGGFYQHSGGRKDDLCFQSLLPPKRGGWLLGETNPRGWDPMSHWSHHVLDQRILKHGIRVEHKQS